MGRLTRRFHLWIPNALSITRRDPANSENLLPTHGRIVRGNQYHCDNYEAVELSVLRYKE